VLFFLNPPVADRHSRTLTQQKKIGKQIFNELKKSGGQPQLNFGGAKQGLKLLSTE
jgi:hypothetical protein